VTTIAYDGSSVCADRYWGSCYGDKLTIVENKIIGFTGPARMYTRVVEYFTSGGEEPDIDNDEVLVVDIESGQAVLYTGKMDPLEMDCPVAVGSGYAFAMGAMATGATAEEAIKIASLYDPGTKVVHQDISQLYVHRRNRGNQTTSV